jgi:hypothetical protein
MALMEACRVCQAPDAEFYAGVKSRCVECHKGAMRARYQAKRHEIAAYDQRRATLPHRVAARAAYKATLSAERIAEYQRRSKAKQPEKVQARGIMYRALKAGRITRPDHCETCREVKPLHGHHDDYAAPLDVRWLCTTCHRQAHEQIAGWGRRITNAHI